MQIQQSINTNQTLVRQTHIIELLMRWLEIDLNRLMTINNWHTSTHLVNGKKPLNGQKFKRDWQICGDYNFHNFIIVIWWETVGFINLAANVGESITFSSLKPLWDTSRISCIQYHIQQRTRDQSEMIETSHRQMQTLTCTQTVIL